MSDWPKTVREALKDSRVTQGISAVALDWMSRHIDENRGRGANGDPAPHRPLKRVSGRYWASSKPKGGFLFARKRTVMRNGKPVKRTFYRVEQVSYRFGGQPLRDTGDLYRSLAATAKNASSSIKLTMQGNRYGLYHDRGFVTKGPIHYVPLTRNGARSHGTGNDPTAEGLTKGRDYILIGTKKRPKGVRVPARPFILPTKRDVVELGRSIYLGLKSVLKGR